MSISLGDWKRIAKRFIKKHPTRSVELLNDILRSMRQISVYDKRLIVEIADEIVRDHPSEAWKIISEILISDTENRRTVIHWLADTGFEDMPRQEMTENETLDGFADTGFEDMPRPSTANYLPAEEVVRWIKEDPEQRQRLILEILPKTIGSGNGWQADAFIYRRIL